jgi:hypothetical protein
MDNPSFQDDTPVGIIQMRSNARCPACSLDMIIAGWYDKEGREVEGKSKVSQHVCLGCGKTVTPVKLINS